MTIFYVHCKGLAYAISRGGVSSRAGVDARAPVQGGSCVWDRGPAKQECRVFGNFGVVAKARKNRVVGVDL